MAHARTGGRRSSPSAAAATRRRPRRSRTCPCWCFHGDEDTAVTVAGSRDMIEAHQEGRRRAEVHRVSRRRPQLVGQGLRHRRAVRVAVEAEEEVTSCRSCSVGPSGTDRYTDFTPLIHDPSRRTLHVRTSRPPRLPRRPAPPPGAAMAFTAASYARVHGANEQHPHRLPRRRRPLPAAHRRHPARCRRRSKAVDPVAVCDVWDGDPTNWAASKGRGLYPSAKRCGLDADDKNHVTKDYRDILDQQGRGRRLHRHARPLARQDDHRRDGGRQGRLLRKADDPDDRRGACRRRCRGKKTSKVMTVGVQSMADPTWRMANELHHAPARSATSCRARPATTATATSASGATTR